MIKTQIQLPDDLYDKVKTLANEREVSMAELCRRGLEYMLRVYPVHTSKKSPWKLPEAKALGKPKIHYSRWREAGHERSITIDSEK